MLTGAALRTELPVGALGVELHFFESTDSTNEQAGQLAQGGAPAGTLVVADEQRRGRGRRGRLWATPPGVALAFSLILRPARSRAVSPGGIGLVGALGVVEGLSRLGLHPQIKWPNDVLIEGRKVCGVLAEASWVGDRLEHLVLGVGVNVREGSLPPESALDFPGTAVELALGRSVDRLPLLLDILQGIDRWYPRLGEPDLLTAWEDCLAFRNEQVELLEGPEPLHGSLLGLTADGRLRLVDPAGEVVEARAEDYRLRPLGAGRQGMR